ncbi:MAG TPA: cell division protein ZapB [bacterium]
MAASIDILEDRVDAVADLVQRLRREVARLERELAERQSVAPPLSPASKDCPPADEQLLEEISRLRAERAAVRERISGLIREIDQVSW